MCTILVVDDDESIRGIVEEVLTDDGHVVETASSAEAALQRIGSGGISLVITDIRMSGIDGIRMLQIIRENHKNIQVIIMTSYATTENAILALKAGACDYLRKPFENLDEIRSTARRALDEARESQQSELMITSLTRRNGELSRLNSSFRDMAIRDGLTDLYNHRYFQEALESQIEIARQSNTPLSVLFIDVDHFKAYNDRFGHLRGDDILKQISRLLESNTTDNDTVARWGGEEFVILAAQSDAKDANELAERLRALIGGHHFSGREAQPGKQITISVGVATLAAGDSIEALVGRADQAVYEAKARGRNKVCIVA